MSVIAARLSNTGTLFTSTAGEGFDETSQTTISVSPNGFFADELDEVTGTENGAAMQQLNSSVLRVSGVFDEVTGIA